MAGAVILEAFASQDAGASFIARRRESVPGSSIGSSFVIHIRVR